MVLTDTHTHLYLEEFNEDREEVVNNAIEKGVQYMLLPNIDSSTTEAMMKMVRTYAGHCFPFMGLHPGSVREDYEDELKMVEQWLDKEKFYAIGEIGIDLYWDKTWQKQQEKAFAYQIGLAKELKLPIVIHMRDSFDEVYRIVKQEASPDLRGVFHCFTGSAGQADKVIDVGFKIGLGGVLTFKNSKLDQSIKQVNLKHIILETDSPYLTPHPYRGKRNQSAYVFYVAQKLAEVKGLSVDEIADITTRNANELFNFIPTDK
ncbi:MAG: TatD family hydrolase [Bacteroidales bacterium]|nr:TatD family hydrolase [Bacteroidales bacterium]